MPFFCYSTCVRMASSICIDRSYKLALTFAMRLYSWPCLSQSAKTKSHAFSTREPANPTRGHPDPTNLKNPSTAARPAVNKNRVKRVNVKGFLQSETEKNKIQYERTHTVPIVYSADAPRGLFIFRPPRQSGEGSETPRAALRLHLYRQSNACCPYLSFIEPV